MKQLEKEKKENFEAAGLGTVIPTRHDRDGDSTKVTKIMMMVKTASLVTHKATTCDHML